MALKLALKLIHDQISTSSLPKELGSNRLLEEFKQYRHDPVGLFEKRLKITLTEEQCEIIQSVLDNRETNVQASHGVGKTFLASLIALWWVLCVGGRCISTAPTRRQVEELLWGEIRKFHSKFNLPGEIGQTFLRVSEDARGKGFTANHRSLNAFQGAHHEYLLIIEDEACGISEEIDDGASSCLSAPENRILRIGNPVEVNTPFERSCKKSHIRIPVWTHPNVAWAYELHDDGIHRLKPEVARIVLLDDGSVLPEGDWPDWMPRSSIPGAVSVSWIEGVRVKYQEGSPYWQSRVEGFFPEFAGQSIIPRNYFLAARARYDANPQKWNAIAAQHPWRHGLDVGDGHDSHAKSRWRGPVLYAIEKKPTLGDLEDTSRAAEWGFDSLMAYGGTIGVDNIGVGAGTLSEIRKMLDGGGEDKSAAFGVNFGAERPKCEEDDYSDELEAANLKAWLYWDLREAIRRGEVAIAPLGELEDELLEDWSGTYYEQSVGKIKIEDKAKTKKRLHRSPDCGDAGIYGWAKAPSVEQWQVGSAVWGY